MHLDVPTLMTIGVFVTSVAGFLLFFAWLGDRGARALLWWAAGDLVWAVGVALILFFGARTGGPLAVLAPALIWSAARVFNQRRPLIPLVLAGPVVQMMCGVLAPVAGLEGLSALVSLSGIALYLFAAAGELLSGRREQLTTRWPLIGFLALHGMVFALGTAQVLTDSITTTPDFPASGWFWLIHFEHIIFSMGSAIFLVAMVRERRELQHKTDAHVDALTGTLTRRAFLEEAERFLNQCKERDAPFSLALFDLDHFKQINDDHGHAAGDYALQNFARLARSRMRVNDLMGRLGGEEFCVAMPSSSVGAAYVVADRIRAAVAEGRVEVSGKTLGITISGGVSTAHPRSTLEEMLEAADTALYRAKTLGRNRVEMAAADANRNKSDAVVIRVA